jgi:glycosyltransferase involved in cell wall biosynthesis
MCVVVYLIGKNGGFMKKILFIHHWSTIGGSGISLFNTWQALKSDYDIVTYIPESPPSLFKFLESKGLEPKTYSFTCGQIPYYSGGSNLLKPGFWYLIVNAIKQVPYWKKVIKQENPDLIIVNSKVLCWMGRIFKGNKSLCFVRETIKGKPTGVINKIMKKMLEDFTIVSFLSEYDLIQTDLKVASSVVSPDFLYPQNYIDRLGKKQACEQLNVDSNSFNIAFVGGVDKLKGIDIAIKAMNYLKDENITLLVAGNDIGDIVQKNKSSILTRTFRRKSIKFSKYVKSYLNHNGLKNSVKFIGVQNDISNLFSAVDILIFPMKEPHQARPAFEIGVQKKPVIISDFPNISEFVKDGVNGLTFQANDPKALAKAILKLKDDKDLLKKLGESNYEYTIKYHTEEYAMKPIIDKIQEII